MLLAGEEHVDVSGVAVPLKPNEVLRNSDLVGPSPPVQGLEALDRSAEPRLLDIFSAAEDACSRELHHLTDT